MQILAFLTLMYWLLILPREILAFLIFGGYLLHCTTGALAWRWRLVRRPPEHDEEHEASEKR